MRAPRKTPRTHQRSGRTGEREVGGASGGRLQPANTSRAATLAMSTARRPLYIGPTTDSVSAATDNDRRTSLTSTDRAVSAVVHQFGAPAIDVAHGLQRWAGACAHHARNWSPGCLPC